jgi:hypothetical protein
MPKKWGGGGALASVELGGVLGRRQFGAGCNSFSKFDAVDKQRADIPVQRYVPSPLPAWEVHT